MSIEQDKKYAIKGSQLEDLGRKIKSALDDSSSALQGLENKVDKVQGKGLSSNDYTNEEKSKLQNVESGAEVNTIETISVNGTAITPDQDKKVDINVPAVENSLTSESTTDALSAKQGKELKTLIDNIPSCVTELTDDDYNWPEDNPRYIALWKLNPGTYKVGLSVSRVYPCQYASFAPTSTGGDMFITVSPKWTTQSNLEVCIVTCPMMLSQVTLSGNYTTYAPAVFRVSIRDGAPLDFDCSTRSNVFNIGILDTSAVVDDLVHANYPRLPLSAKQGYVLNNNIGQLSSLTTTDKSSAVAAINELSSDIEDIEPSSGSGAPTISTEGTLGQDYVDTTTGDKYYLSSIDETTTPTTYTWTKYTTGTGVNVVQTTGTSTADVMSQNAITSMVYADPGTEVKIQIGSGASTTGADSALSIGSNSTSSEKGSVAIGPSAQATHAGSVALGSGARTSAQGEVQIGTIFSAKGYNGSNYRLLTGVYDPQSAHDAATKGYVDTNIPDAPSSADFNALFD